MPTWFRQWQAAWWHLAIIWTHIHWFGPIALGRRQLYEIIITKNIRYLLWNRRFWRSLNNTYPIFLTPCIRRTNHLCDSCDLTDVNPHFIPSRLRMIQNVDLLWRHPNELQELAASNCDVTMTNCSRVVAMDAFLTQWCWEQWFNEFLKDTYVPCVIWNTYPDIWNRKFITAQWSIENTSCFNFFVKLFFYFVTPPPPVFQHGASLVWND